MVMYIVQVLQPRPSTSTWLGMSCGKNGGHINVPKAVLFGELSTGKRDHGAPKKRYIDQLKREPFLGGCPTSFLAASCFKQRQLANNSQPKPLSMKVLLQRRDTSSEKKRLLIKSLPFLPTSVQTVRQSVLLVLVLLAMLEPARRRPSPDLHLRGTAIIINMSSWDCSLLKFKLQNFNMSMKPKCYNIICSNCQPSVKWIVNTGIVNYTHSAGWAHPGVNNLQ